MGHKKLRNSESENEENQNTNEDEPPKKKECKFSAREFIQQLGTKDSRSSIIEFVRLCTEANNEQNYAFDFVENGGTCADLLNVIEKSDNKNASHLLPSIKALNFVLLEIITSFSDKIGDAEEACLQLLTKNYAVIKSMLSLNSNATQRKIALKLLTAMVALSPSLVKEVLSHVAFNQSVLSLLTRSSCLTDGTSVRTSFIYFLMSFLVDGNTSTVLTFLSKRGLLTTIFPGLIFDTVEIVQLVIDTLKEHILEDKLIPKEIKMGVFNTYSIKCLVNLYNWKGPGNWNKSRTVPLVDETKKAIVSDCVHKFLIILCTSKTHGIVIRDPTLGTGFRRYNNLMFSVLNSFDKPWNHKFAADLVTKICVSCPDLFGFVVSSMGESLEPRDTEKWLNAIRFVRNLIEQLEPEKVETYLMNMSVKQLMSVLTKLCVPRVLFSIITKETILHERILVRHESILLLWSMLESVDKYLEVINKSSAFSSGNKSNLKSEMRRYLKAHLPPASIILSDCKKSTSPTNEEEYDLPQHLDVLLNVLLKYSKICPELVGDITDEMDSTSFLRPIESLQSETKVSIELKAIKFLMWSNPSAFLPTTNLFSYTFPILLKFYYETSDDLQLEIESTLTDLLTNTGVFKCLNENEIMIWLHSILELNSYDTDIGTFLVDAVRKTNKKFLKYVSELTSFQTTENVSSPDVSEIIRSLEQSNDDEVKETVDKTLRITLSPLIKGFLDSLETNKSEGVVHYANVVLVHLLHSQTFPTILTTLLLRHYKEFVDKGLVKYCESWTTGTKLRSLKKVYNSSSILYKLSKYLINEDDELDFTEVLTGLKPYYLPLVTNLISFYFTQLCTKSELAEWQYQKSVQVLLYLIKTYDTSLDCIQTLLKHPVLLNNFSIKPKQPVAKTCNQFIVTMIQTMLKTSTESRLDSVLTCYRASLTKQLCQTLASWKEKKSRKFGKTIELIQMFHLTYDQGSSILELIVNLPTPLFVFHNKERSDLLELIICVFSCNETEGRPFADELIVKFVQQLNKSGCSALDYKSDKFQNCLYAYVKQFPHVAIHFNKTFYKKLTCGSSSNKSNIKLATLLLELNTPLLKSLTSYFPEILPNKELVFSLLNSVLHLDCLTLKPVLDKVYKEHEAVVIKALNKPQKTPKYLSDHYKVLIQLILQCMDADSCKQFASKVHKFDVTELFHFEILTSVFEKAITLDESEASRRKYLTSYIFTVINILVNLLKSQEKSDTDWIKTEELFNKFYNYIFKFKSDYKIDYLNNDLFKNPTVQTCSKLSLKFGLQQKPVLLDVLKQLCELSAYNEYFSELFDMAMSHSETLNLLLSRNESKASFIKLLVSICEKCPKVMVKSHIVIWLGAYNATLSESDQSVLKLLALYEKADVGFYTFRPYLWGTAAVGHYSLKSGIESTLWRQARTNDVLEIFDEARIKKTVAKFPRSRGLKPTLDPYSNEDSDVYDPAFYLPLLSHVMAPEYLTPWFLCSRNGILSLVIVALSSAVDEVREAAWHVLNRFYNNVEASKKSRKLLWLYFIQSICRGVSSLSNMRLNSIAAVFLARCAYVFSRPDNHMYAILGNYFRFKECPDFTYVPQLFELLHDTSMNGREFRHFILEVIRDGLRNKYDMTVLFRSVAFKLLMDLYNSVLIDHKSQTIILEILSAAVKVLSGAHILLSDYNIISWLYIILSQPTSKDSNHLHIIINITTNLVTNSDNISIDIKFSVLLFLQRIIHIFKTERVELEDLVSYLKLLSKLCGHSNVITRTNLLDLLEISSKLFDCSYSRYCLMHNYMCQKTLHSEKLEDQAQFYLKTAIVKWIETNSNNASENF